MELLLGNKLLNKFRKLVVSDEALRNKSIIILYFGALWCKSPECKIVLQKLTEVYKENLKRNSGIEIVYISSDDNEDDFNAIYKSMGGWLAVPYQDELADQLRTIYGVTTIPNLIVIRKNGDIITRLGKQEIIEKGINVLVTWSD